MKVLFVASECAPLAKIGGLADVVGSLPKALKNLGFDIRICLPKYQTIDLNKSRFELIAKNLIVRNEKVDIYQGFLPESQVIVYLLENEKYLSQGGIYFNEIQRFLFFSRATLEIFPVVKWFPDIIHCHDWHAAIIPLLLKSDIYHLAPRTLLTVHNLAQQGKWNAREVLDFLNFKKEKVKNLEIKNDTGDFNILQQGILHAGLINTVSPNYAREILTKEYGEGLEEWLLKRKKEVFGVLNGIDEKKFSPETDPNLSFNYSFQSLEKKIENKIHLQEILNLNKNRQIPLLAFIGRLDSQKGVDLVIRIAPDLLRNNCQLVILGKGNPDYEKGLLGLSQKYPQSISSQIKFDSVLAQKIYAGADIFLIPSRFEPCGLVQMIAMRYGSIPIARDTGGLADTIEEEKTGFLFKEYNTKSFLESVEKALNLYQDRKVWLKLTKRAMEKDFSWKKSALEYHQLYRQLLQ